MGTVRYPGGVRSTGHQAAVKPVTYGNRGMEFEAEIEATNDYYRSMKLGKVNKRATPIKVVKMDYAHNRITEGYFHKKSTVDFEGLSRGIHLEFDCKECTIASRFPLDYIEPHQIENLLEVKEQGGVGFFLIKFVPEQTVYFVLIDQIMLWQASDLRKSIPRAWLEENTPQVPRQGIGRWDYLPLVWGAK